MIGDKLETILDYQQLIDQSIRRLGGYWRTLSGLARVTEEVGELAELLITKEKDPDTIGGELADVFIITTCLANQFATDLTGEYEKIGLPTNVSEIQFSNKNVPASDLLLALIRRAGTIARIINHYDGDKPMKQTEKPLSLGGQIAIFHQELFHFASALRCSLFDHVATTIRKNLKRDQNRFAITSDPITEPVAMEALGLSTLFQQGSRFWSACPWDPTQSKEQNLSITQLTVNRFKKCARTEGLDGLILTMPPQEKDVHKQFQLDPTRFSVSAQETEGLATYIIKSVY
ncbi:MazG nucleotide pyrophosphohydrolase domain-containing protein [Alkalihalobacillus sp. FSL W8-0930]